jgi:hypothetical protein
MADSTVWLGVSLVTGALAMAWPFITGRVDDTLFIMAGIAAATTSILSSIEERPIDAKLKETV